MSMKKHEEKYQSHRMGVLLVSDIDCRDDLVAKDLHPSQLVPDRLYDIYVEWEDGQEPYSRNKIHPVSVFSTVADIRGIEGISSRIYIAPSK